MPLTLTPRQDMPFLFDSYRELMRDLGAMDGLAAAQTLAAKHFIDHAATHADPQQFVRDLAVRYRVSTHFVDFPSVPTHLTQLLIVGHANKPRPFWTISDENSCIWGGYGGNDRTASHR